MAVAVGEREGMGRARAGMARSVRSVPTAVSHGHAAVLEAARVAGLLDGESSEQVSFRVPLALLEAVKREAGVSSVTEVRLPAPALLARPDPVVDAMRRTRGRLGLDHQLEV